MTLDEALAAIDKRGWRVFMLGHASTGVWILDLVQKNAKPGDLPAYQSAKGRTPLEACQQWLFSSNKKLDRVPAEIGQKLKDAILANAQARYEMNGDDVEDFLGL